MSKFEHFAGKLIETNECELFSLKELLEGAHPSQKVWVGFNTFTNHGERFKICPVIDVTTHPKGAKNQVVLVISIGKVKVKAITVDEVLKHDKLVNIKSVHAISLDGEFSEQHGYFRSCPPMHDGNRVTLRAIH